MSSYYSNPTENMAIRAVEQELERARRTYDFAVLDIHAEATSEKLALAHWFDGRVRVMFGTHTHVQTADEQILPGGTGYVTDLGMCGGADGVMGISSDVILKRYLTGLPEKFTPAEGPIVCDGVIFTVDDVSGKTLSTQRVRF